MLPLADVHDIVKSELEEIVANIQMMLHGSHAIR